MKKRFESVVGVLLVAVLAIAGNGLLREVAHSQEAGKGDMADILDSLDIILDDLEYLPDIMDQLDEMEKKLDTMDKRLTKMEKLKIIKQKQSKGRPIEMVSLLK